jgi:uncharacterized membrane protein YcjF (UPF0283 family)
MNTTLENTLNSEQSDRLFFYFRHDGAIDFEKKVIAGKILNERGFDRNKLLKEKKLLSDSIRHQISAFENVNLLVKNKRKINKRILFGLVYISLFMVIGLKDIVLTGESLKRADWIGISIMVLLALTYIVYKLVTYMTKLKQLMASDNKEKELLKLRLQFIEKEWDF